MIIKLIDDRKFQKHDNNDYCKYISAKISFGV